MSNKPRLCTPLAFLTCLFLVFSPLINAQTANLVKTARLADIAVYPQKSAPATVVSLNNTLLSTQIKARVEEIFVKVGEVVEAGSVLARLDCTYYDLAAQQTKARIASLQARIKLAERRLERTRKLIESKTVTEELLDQREAELAVLHADREAALSSLKEAETDVSHCLLKSPYRAVITARIGAVGDFAKEGTKLFEIVDFEQLEVSAQLPIGDVDQVNHISALYFEDSAGRYPVKIRTTVPAINTRTRNQEVRLLFVDESALPGAAGRLVWRDERPHVPGKLLVRRNDSFGVFLAKQGKARFKIISDAQPGRPTPIDLAPDTLLITEGQHALRDSQTISVIP